MSSADGWPASSYGGSDFPFLAPQRCLAELDGLGLPDEVLGKVLYQNAARILRLP